MFPHADGVSKTMSPQNIIIGTMANYDLHCRVPFGAYVKYTTSTTPVTPRSHSRQLLSLLIPPVTFRAATTCHRKMYQPTTMDRTAHHRRRYCSCARTCARRERLRPQGFGPQHALDPIHVPDPGGAIRIDIIHGNKEEEEEEEQEQEEQEQEQEETDANQGVTREVIERQHDGALEAQEAPENEDNDEQGAQEAIKNENDEEQGAQGAFDNDQGAQGASNNEDDAATPQRSHRPVRDEPCNFW
jgi:hypothetical protein